MRIVFIEIRNFRGIKKLDWGPSPGINCLIGPGDSTKTTILDAIEYALTPRSYIFADDSDFYDADYKTPIIITITLADLPPEFLADDRYGLHLRGWNSTGMRIEDESGRGLDDALSLRLSVDESLEGHWSIFNERIGEDAEDPPSMRYKDARQIAPTRLGPYAEKHLGWGRESVLKRVTPTIENINLQLAEAGRGAREAFKKSKGTAFQKTASRAEELGRLFSVPIRENYAADLDVQNVSITSGGIALHDGKLPLRQLGTGSSRLLVSALQHDAGPSQLALIDEIEHGLEPHRIARLLKHIKGPVRDRTKPQQVFITTHSPVVIRELTVTEIFRVRSADGTTTVDSVSAGATDVNTAQRHLRRTPEAFLARRVIVGEGKTEQGIARGLDLSWIEDGKDSFALHGVIAADGEGNTTAPVFALHLLDLGYAIFLLLDTDVPPPASSVARVKGKGGVVVEWPDKCSTEERVFLDVPWESVVTLVRLAEQSFGSDSVRDSVNHICSTQHVTALADLVLQKSLDTVPLRRAIGMAAKRKNWFKDIERGEQVGAIIAACLTKIPSTPLARALLSMRDWLDD